MASGRSASRSSIPRWPSFDFDWLDNTADNSSCAGVRFGEFVPLTDPATVEVDFTDNASVLHGCGANAMGDPCAAVAWLLRALDREGSSLPAGSIVFTGGLTAPFDLGGGRTYKLTAPSAQMPSLELHTT